MKLRLVSKHGVGPDGKTGPVDIEVATQGRRCYSCYYQQGHTCGLFGANIAWKLALQPGFIMTRCQPCQEAEDRYRREAVGEQHLIVLGPPQRPEIWDHLFRARDTTVLLAPPDHSWPIRFPKPDDDPTPNDD